MYLPLRFRVQFANMVVQHGIGKPQSVDYSQQTQILYTIISTPIDCVSKLNYVGLFLICILRRLLLFEKHTTQTTAMIHWYCHTAN